MHYERVLPENFDGTFRFTNWSDEDFVAKWDKKEYLFYANTTAPLIIANATPLEVQQIRKKFAKDLAEREFFKSSNYRKLLQRERTADGQPLLNSLHGGAAYDLGILAPLIQRALEPLAVKNAEVRAEITEPLEDKLSRNNDGELNTEAIGLNESLRERAKRGRPRKVLDNYEATA